METENSSPNDLKSCKVEDTAEKTATPTKVLEASAKLYRWASSQVSEAIEKGEDKFYPTKLFNSLRFKIKNTNKEVIAVSGLQGTGKTRLLGQLATAMPKSIMIKWTRNWQKEALNWSQVMSQYFEYVKNESEARLEEWGRTGIKRHIVSKLRRNMSEDGLDYSNGEMVLGKAYCNELKKQALEMFIGEFSVLLLDLPDYSKSNVGLMNADIDELQSFWEVLDKNNVHIIIGVQKELVMRHPHFFWGKCDMMTLEPLPPEEMVDAYKLITEDNEVFDESALQLLAVLSRGIFRRFKKYIRLSIENNLDENIPLIAKHVRKAVGEKQLFEDMELELCDVFTDREKRLQSLSVLSFLLKKDRVNIKTISEAVNLTETVTQKITRKLALYGYVGTERGVGKEKLVRLRL